MKSQVKSPVVTIRYSGSSTAWVGCVPPPVVVPGRSFGWWRWRRRWRPERPATTPGSWSGTSRLRRRCTFHCKIKQCNDVRELTGHGYIVFGPAAVVCHVDPGSSSRVWPQQTKSIVAFCFATQWSPRDGVGGEFIGRWQRRWIGRTYGAEHVRIYGGGRGVTKVLRNVLCGCGVEGSWMNYFFGLFEAKMLSVLNTFTPFFFPRAENEQEIHSSQD